MKVNHNLPNKQVTSNNTTGKPLPFSDRSGSNGRIHRNNSRHTSPYKISQFNSKHYYSNTNFKPPIRSDSTYPRPSNPRKTLIIALDHNHLNIIEMEIVHDNHSYVMDLVTSETI